MASRMAFGLAAGLALGANPFAPSLARAEDPPASLSAIDADFDRDLAKLEKTRLERLTKLAAGSTGAEADRVYEACFRLAIDASLYAEAQPAAQAAMKTKGLNPRVSLMAHLVDLVAQANRGEYEASLRSLEAAIANPPQDTQALPVAMKLALIEAYYQKLVQSGQTAIADKALKAIQAKAQDPAIADLAARRLAQLDLVGKPAPAIDGTDVDGKPFSLAAQKGHPVLVVFWATWCLPNAQEIDALTEAYTQFGPKGLKIVGVNLDSFQAEGRAAETVASDVRRFLVERNVRWTNLIERPGERDLTKAYAISDIPANVLVGRDGKVVQIDLTAANLKRVIGKAIEP